MKRNLILVVCVVALVSAMVWIGAKQCFAPEVTATAHASPPVVTQNFPKPEKKNEWDGKVKLAHGCLAVLSPSLETYVKEIRVVNGQRVKKGDILIVLDDGQVAAIQQKKCDVCAAQACVRSAEETAKTARKEYERDEGLKKKTSVSDSDMDNSSCASKKADASLVSALATLKAAESTLKVYCDSLYIRAPIDGVVEDLHVELGENTSPQAGNNQVVYGTIKRLDTVDVEFEATEKEADSNLKPGAKIVVFADKERKEQFDAVITSASVELKPGQKVTLTANVPKANWRLRINKEVIIPK